MAPSAMPIDQGESTSDLTSSAISHTLAKTAPSTTRFPEPTNGTSNLLAELDASLLTTTYTSTPRPVPLPNSAECRAQKTCTDHMLTCLWTASHGWHSPEIKSYGPLSIMPTASVLHYATECFEGLKLYRGHDGLLRLFRPDCNARRMLASATRIALPGFPPEELLKLIKTLCATDGPKWLPRSRPGQFLYVRPTMIATDSTLGVQKPKEALLYIILACFPAMDEKQKGLSLLASQDDTVRAWPGGFGYAKVGANYGPTLVAQGEARRRGYDQVLWLLGNDGKIEVTEAGASNFFVVWRTREGKMEMVTAPLGDKIILDGVTRRSVLQLAREKFKKDIGDGAREEVQVLERNFEMQEIVNAVEEGRMVESFAAGTAFFIAPVSCIHYRGQDLSIPMGEASTGSYAGLLKTKLKNIMYGKEKHEWGVVVDEAA